MFLASQERQSELGLSLHALMFANADQRYLKETGSDEIGKLFFKREGDRTSARDWLSSTLMRLIYPNVFAGDGDDLVWREMLMRGRTWEAIRQLYPPEPSQRS
ncbi:hypothetical protein [Rhizobium sp. PL01]|uniref:hypothetical protein n=1 Tax=Rhizobium sp. PL01 TaxID=3085631 RepID=UPI002981DBE6|nr:hypothetical protein [Rhizobium sp. PL01]MDW5316506.1 hypothetical protein [Rhizobium sp. PL01]